MNIFLPYENEIEKSVEALDDRRLNKQILECYQLLVSAIKEVNGEEIKGYKNHPIYKHYKKNIPFLIAYGDTCADEYYYRFHRRHGLALRFAEALLDYYVIKGYVVYEPFYMEGSKGQPNFIRTTENVSELYQRKLILEWDNDKANGRPPKWTNREVPIFYKLREIDI